MPRLKKWVPTEVCGAGTERSDFRHLSGKKHGSNLHVSQENDFYD